MVEIFRRIRERVPARLLLVGDGPDLSPVCRLARDAGLGDAVQPLGEQELVVPILSVADLFLLPSSQESFGLAALEAMACEVPVVASRVGGLPEVIEHGVNGFLHPVEDLSAMTASAVNLLTDPDLHERVRARAGAPCRSDSAPTRSCHVTKRSIARCSPATGSASPAASSARPEHPSMQPEPRLYSATCS